LDRKILLAYIGLILAVIFWGGSFVATKIALREIQPVTVVWLRFAIGVIILGMAVVRKKEWAVPTRKDLAYFSLLGFIGITFHQWLQSTGLTTSQASTTAWIVATTPVFMAILGWLVLKEILAWFQVAGILLATLGVILVVSEGKINEIFSLNLGRPGDLLILLSAPNWAVFSVLSRNGLKKHPSNRMMFFVMTMGWVFTTIMFMFGSGLNDLRNLTYSGWVAILFLGIFCSGFAYIFWYDGLQVLSVAQAGAFVYLEPFITVILAAAILDEKLTWASILGGITILIGIWLVQTKLIKNN
jgi:drug/metabolite transporter (DMT)-like permease